MHDELHIVVAFPRDLVHPQLLSVEEGVRNAAALPERCDRVLQPIQERDTHGNSDVLILAVSHSNNTLHTVCSSNPAAQAAQHSSSCNRSALFRSSASDVMLTPHHSPPAGRTQLSITKRRLSDPALIPGAAAFQFWPHGFLS